ncbi:cobyrinic acid a,c-diamide synthase [Denitratisoma sp. DHT3]|nr:cobyrinic acid a,c-diamide synthase [Denitratisoma sp. DHT3]
MLISAPASGQGKTLVTAALARRHRALGRRVRVFKTGPDFLDPMVLERASGAPVYQLDLHMGGAAHCRRLLFEAAAEADLILIEGVMGLYDGAPSSADLALLFDVPVLVVIDGAAMAQTFGAVALGLARYRPGLRVHGVLANRVGGSRHAEMLRESLDPAPAWFGALPCEQDWALPERHLGLFQAAEIADLDLRLERAAQALGPAAERLPPPVDFAAPAPGAAPPRLLDGVRIAVARDAAFAFIYRANEDLLQVMGATLQYFSPLADAVLPACDALWLPGGYPELHHPPLAANGTMAASVRAHHAAGKPILAECGGMLALCETLTDAAGGSSSLWGLLPGRAVMGERLAALGLQSLRLPEGELRGHTFHFSRLETALVPWARAVDPDGRPGEAAYRLGRLTASYMHCYFPSAPRLAAGLFLP